MLSRAGGLGIVLALVMGMVGPVWAAQESLDAGERLVDKVVAVVEGKPIFLSELDRAMGCFQGEARYADQTSILRMLILQRVILAEALRLRLLENVNLEQDLSEVVRKFIDTSIRPFVRVQPASEKSMQEPEDRAAAGKSAQEANPLLEILTARLQALWDKTQIVILPGPWGQDMGPPNRKDVECLLLASTSGTS